MTSSLDLRYTSHLSDEEYSQYKLHAYIYILPIQFLGVFGWLLCLIAIFRDRLHQDPNYILIINLGIADLLLATSSFSQVMAVLPNQGFIGGYFQSSAILYASMLAFISSPMAVISIALDRYLVFVHRIQKTVKTTAGLLIMVWFAAIGIGSLQFFLNLPDIILLAKGVILMPDFTSRQPLLRGIMIFDLVWMYVGLLMVVYMYSAIYFRYKQALKKRNEDPLTNNLPPEMSANAMKLMKRFSIICTIFVICFSPIIFLFTFMAITQDAEKFSYTALVLCIGFFELSAASNPIILYILDAKIKRSVNEFLGLHRFSFFNAKKSFGISSFKKNIEMKEIPQNILPDTVPANSLVKTVLIRE